MFGLFKRKKKQAEATLEALSEKPTTISTTTPEADLEADLVEKTAPEQPIEQPAAAVIEPVVKPITEPIIEPNPPKKVGLFARLKQGLARTGSGLADLFLGSRKIDDELLEELETRLLMADVGMTATREIITNLTDKVKRNQLKDSDALFAALKDELKLILQPVCKPLVLVDKPEKPQVILMIGVNGVGKTTTIGKLAKRYQKEGRKVLLAAGDTFRAAAVEQLQIWGDRNSVPVIAQHTGADSASVIFDALKAAQSRKADLLIADTAGRLHNKSNLMEELSKVHRVMQKIDPEAPHEVLLVLDAATGQNALAQARQFNKSVPITGLVLTKLDGTAKGGIVFALARELNIPVRFIGVGEQADDLRDFDADSFVDALLAVETD
ncbi:MAG TPA: signal recognition particle-docking protein FtsY [Marinospirillum sp.]|uniref:signal recognition particle-docking protein FtsY n=1 Tax=Marinospirillum sp. TaxID=2183934 RepID=UPI002B489359|nr:signal recognition particle-docking protein FtsY [Marinospirillum sp.]HKM15235.1 signal recognition particle-docking protein FtsY [Marinospirillum sp.]